MRIGFDANTMVGEMGGVGWHSYHLLRTMLAQHEGLDVVAYARPGAEQPDSVRVWPGVERLQWVNSSRWGMGKRGSSDRLDLYHGTNFKMQTVGRYGGVVTIHDRPVARLLISKQRSFRHTVASQTLMPVQVVFRQI